MIISSMATTLAERYSVDFVKEALLTQSDPLHIEIIAPVLARRSIDQIYSCFLSRSHVTEPWLLSTYSKYFDYAETSLNQAAVTLYNRSLAATLMVGISGRSIPITRVVEGSATRNPFFLHNDVVLDTIIAGQRLDWDAKRWQPTLKFRILF